MNTDAPETREIVIVTDEEEKARRVSPRDENTGTRAAAVRTYQRRPARAETSSKGSEEAPQLATPGQETGDIMDSPERSAVVSPRRRRRLIISEISAEEEAEEVPFTLFDAQPISGQPDPPADVEDKERERRERKRKGKTLATPVKKKPRQASTTLVIQEDRQRVEERVGEEEETSRLERRSKRRHDGVRSVSERRPVMARVQFEKMQVRLDNELLGRMLTFDDPQMTLECEARIGRGKKVRSGRRLCEEALDKLEAAEEFMELITGIGFDWLLAPSSPSMPLELAQEFFTSFRFTNSTDVGAESISFRFFTREMRMSIREWSVRLGLYNADQEVEWFGRDIGPPKDIPDFDMQTAWEEIVPRGTKAFQPTTSTADCIKNPVLRLAQVFIGTNLLGQANTVASLTEAELYFVWCMMRKRKVHLGYWLARTCQSISSRAARHLNSCHIPGAIFTNCVEVTIVEKLHRMTYVPKPELFGIQFLSNVGILVQRGGTHMFYKVTRPESQQEGTGKKKLRTKQAKMVVAGAEEETRLRIEDAPPTMRTQGETAMPSTSAAPEMSPGHASLVELVGNLDDWRNRMEGHIEKIAQNTERIAQNSEAQTQMLASQAEIQMKHNEDVRASVAAVREMVSLMARELIPRRQRGPHHTAQGSRRPAGGDGSHSRDLPRR